MLILLVQGSSRKFHSTVSELLLALQKHGLLDLRPRFCFRQSRLWPLLEFAYNNFQKMLLLQIWEPPFENHNIRASFLSFSITKNVFSSLLIKSNPNASSRSPWNSF